MEKICFRIQKHRITFNNELHKKKSINGFKVRLENRAKPEYGGKYYYHREGVFLRYWTHQAERGNPAESKQSDLTIFRLDAHSASSLQDIGQQRMCT